MSLLGLPNEIILAIIRSDALDISGLWSLQYTNRRIYALVFPDIVRLHRSRILTWASKHGYISLVQLALAQGASIDTISQGKDRGTALHHAAINGHVTVAEVLFKHGANLEVRDPNRSLTPLHWAAAGKSENTAKFLLERGADITIKDLQGYTVLDIVAKEGEGKLARLFIENGVDMTSVDGRGWGCILWAAKSGNAALVEMLINNGASMEFRDRDQDNPLTVAAKEGHGAVVQFLVDKGAYIDHTNSSGMTALLLAICRGHDTVARFLINKGANIHYSPTSTPLFAATSRMVFPPRPEAIIQLLVEKGADINTQDSNNTTPLHCAVERDLETVVNLFLSKGASIDVRNKQGFGALHFAVTRRHISIAKLLLQKGADVNGHEANHPTPLILAAESGDIIMVKLLLDAGADLQLLLAGNARPATQGIEALYTTACGLHIAVVQLLLERGVDVNATWRDGRQTALHGAVYSRVQSIENIEAQRQAVVKLLLEKGADVAARDALGQTALHQATTRASCEIITLLLDRGADINAQDDHGEAALHVMTSHWNYDHRDIVWIPVARLLLERGANLNVKNGNGLTAMEVEEGMANDGTHWRKRWLLRKLVAGGNPHPLGQWQSVG